MVGGGGAGGCGAGGCGHRLCTWFTFEIEKFMTFLLISWQCLTQFYWLVPHFKDNLILFHSSKSHVNCLLCIETKWVWVSMGGVETRQIWMGEGTWGGN